MLVKFIARSDIYFPGDVAGFPEDQCARLINARAAVAVDPFEQATAPADEVTSLTDEATSVPPHGTALFRRRRSK